MSVIKNRFITLMKFGDELRWGLEDSLYDISEHERENSYSLKIEINKELYDYLYEKFYKEVNNE